MRVCRCEHIYVQIMTDFSGIWTVRPVLCGDSCSEEMLPTVEAQVLYSTRHCQSPTYTLTSELLTCFTHSIHITTSPIWQWASAPLGRLQTTLSLRYLDFCPAGMHEPGHSKLSWSFTSFKQLCRLGSASRPETEVWLKQGKWLRSP